MMTSLSYLIWACALSARPASVNSFTAFHPRRASLVSRVTSVPDTLVTPTRGWALSSKSPDEESSSPVDDESDIEPVKSESSDEEEVPSSTDDETDTEEAKPESPVEEEVEFKSAALEWSKLMNGDGDGDDVVNEAADDMETNVEETKKKFVVIGGGWGGWGAAKTICQSGVNAEVILIDALPDPTGATPYVSKSGKPVEAGTRGFWKDYPNINALCSELSLDEDDVFTPYTNSSFYSPDGLEATAPVFSSAEFPTLPSPFGQVFATFPLFERIPLSDRASMVGLLLATIDCLGGDESVQESYDRMTAHELFLRFGISTRMVQDFIKPTLLVGLFKPPEELSALVVMELLYYYALAHQDSFDVRWIKNGTVSDSLIAPMAEMLQEDHGLNVLGGCRVGEISLGETDNGKLQATSVEYKTAKGYTEKIEDVDGVILALGCKGMQFVIGASPDLARLPEFSRAASLKGIDVISTRIWLDRTVKTRTPANVFSRFEALRDSGGTFFMLDQFQEDHQEALWGGEEVQGSVVACDFYNAGAVMSLSDDDIIKTLMEDLLPSAVPQFADAKVVDSWVGKYPGSVSWFSPGSYKFRPPLEGAGEDTLPNVKCAGDWVRMGEREHGAKGLCQERAYVSGMEAANSLLESSGLGGSKKADVLPVREDEPQFQLGVKVNNAIMNFIPRFWVR